MSEVFSPELLHKKREEAGLSKSQLSFLTEVSRTSIMDYETDKRIPTAKIWERLLVGLSHKKVSKQMVADTWREVEPITPPLIRPSFTFEVGHVYSITDHKFGGKYVDGINPQYGTLCKFEYKGKQGIHHCFIEVKGGWSRTYTDVQLMGKNIKELME